MFDNIERKKKHFDEFLIKRIFFVQVQDIKDVLIGNNCTFLKEYNQKGIL